MICIPLTPDRVRPLARPCSAVNPPDLRVLLSEHGVLRIHGIFDERLLKTMVTVAGLFPQPQYETVYAGAADPYVLRGLAESGRGPTPATEPKPTEPHIDAYQFDAQYRGQVIAGIGHMPDVDLLFYPRVEEERCLVTYGLPAALSAVEAASPNFLAALMSRKFRVNIENYREADPDLSDPPEFAVFYPDELGWRFQIGGRVYSEMASAQFALDLFRTHLRSVDVHVFNVSAGDAFLMNQRVVAHSGIRRRTNGQTVLVRRLLRWEREREESCVAVPKTYSRHGERL